MSSPADTPATSPHLPNAAVRRRYWLRNRRLTAGLLFLWMAVTFLVAFFARELSFSFFGWPFSFWMAAQGAPLVYLVLVLVYAAAMNRLDRRFEVDEDD
jgi:putative solute:sodium symporter small subunit